MAWKMVNLSFVFFSKFGVSRQESVFKIASSNIHKYTNKIAIIFILILYSINSFSQNLKTIYFVPGQGSDKRIFDSLQIKKNYKLVYLEYGTPEKKQTLNSFAKQLSRQIDTTESFVLIGVSLGGMICSEINEFLNPEKVIIISSAKNRKELPFRYRFQKYIPIYKIFPASVIFLGAKILQPIVEPDRNKNKQTFKSMLNSKNPKYIKRTVGLIINWNRTENSKDIVHIHGTKDHTIPIRNVSNPNYIIKNGSHLMTLTRASEISKIINLELTKN